MNTRKLSELKIILFYFVVIKRFETFIINVGIIFNEYYFGINNVICNNE